MYLYILGNYLRGYETLDSNLLIRINNYLNFIASYNNYFLNLKFKYNIVVKDIMHKRKIKQNIIEDDLVYLNYLEERYNFILESYDNIILKYNNKILYELLAQLDFT